MKEKKVLNLQKEAREIARQAALLNAYYNLLKKDIQREILTEVNKRFDELEKQLKRDFRLLEITDELKTKGDVNYV